MLTILIILLFLFLLFTNINERFSVVNEGFIDINNIKNITKKISINRPIESENLKIVKNIVINELKEIGLFVEEQKFIKNNHQFSNIVAINKLENNCKYILLSAHIDSIKDNIESTIDSATSIAIILHLAKKLINDKPKYPLFIVFFDGEEAVDGPWSKDNTLFGSRYFVENLKYDIEFAYILDLIGGNFKNKIATFSNNIKSKPIIKELYELNKKYTNIIFENPEEFISNKIIEDDHIPFKENNINYVHLIPYNFPEFHHSINDNYNNVNWEYIEIFTKILYKNLLYV